MGEMLWDQSNDRDAQSAVAATAPAGRAGFGARLLDLLLPRSMARSRSAPLVPRQVRPAARAPARRMGKVYLVGGGPGNPELLTLRAARLLACADAVVYDALIGAEVLAMIPRATQRIYVGKQSGRHTLPQGEINRLLVRLAQEGKQVVRLKGGDPFIFGRGGEELEELAAAGVEFEVVPGITAASGMAAYAGIPLTHRGHARACVFATGHLMDDSCDLDWPALARPQQTLVIYMGVGALPVICRQLVAHGLAPDTPAALVQNATTAAQRSVAGSLAALPELAAAAGIQAPALIVVGEVVSLQAQLHWFRPQAEAQSGAARETLAA